jgi:hypothetical protein
VAEEGELDAGEELYGDVNAAGHQRCQATHSEHHHPSQAVLQRSTQTYVNQKKEKVAPALQIFFNFLKKLSAGLHYRLT